MQLFTNQASNAASASFKRFEGGDDGNALNVYVSGNFGSGTVTVEAQLPDGSGWVKVPGGAITVAGMYVITAGPFVGRLNLTGAVAPSLNAWVEVDCTAERDRVRAVTI